MTQHPDSPSTSSVLIIDSSKSQRIFWGTLLRRCSSAYEIVEAADGTSGLALYRSRLAPGRARRIDCVVLELDMPNETGFETLMELVPHASKPQIAVIILTKILPRGVWELVTQMGAYACLAKPYTTGEGLDRAIQDAIAFVAQIPREDGHQSCPSRRSSSGRVPESSRASADDSENTQETGSERQQNVQHSTGMET